MKTNFKINTNRFDRSIQGSIVVNKKSGFVTVHFYAPQDMTIKKGEKLYIEAYINERTLNPNFFRTGIVFSQNIKDCTTLQEYKAKYEKGAKND